VNLFIICRKDWWREEVDLGGNKWARGLLLHQFIQFGSAHIATKTKSGMGKSVDSVLLFQNVMKQWWDLQLRIRLSNSKTFFGTKNTRNWLLSLLILGNLEGDYFWWIGRVLKLPWGNAPKKLRGHNRQTRIPDDRHINWLKNDNFLVLLWTLLRLALKNVYKKMAESKEEFILIRKNTIFQCFAQFWFFVFCPILIFVFCPILIFVFCPILIFYFALIWFNCVLPNSDFCLSPILILVCFTLLWLFCVLPHSDF